MKTIAQLYPTRAFTAVDLLIVIATIVVIAGIALPMMSKPKGGSSLRIRCVSNLKQVGLGFRLYANDNEDPSVPYSAYNPTNSAWNYLQTVGKEIGSPRDLLCPADTSRTQAALDFESNGSIDNFSSSNKQNSALSYFYGVDASETQPNMILAGDRNVSTNKLILSGLLNVTTNTPLKWTANMHKDAGNVVMADGSAQQLTTVKLREAIQWSEMSNSVQRFIIP